ncbi:UNVERIFIED_CONTAM: NDR1/HIN1-like protein 26 [Sesamum latifolium]|uniref:NDR1/HIN1-like protein 26 n=1 Tax=Sesamum latifolium TaxID=2727402 RepID=A0AAW2T6Y4_9LAMI
MSQIHEKSPKHCANKQAINLHKFNKKLLFSFSTLFLSILSLIFLVWLVLHPTKPQFSLKEADINQLNLSGPSLLNSSIQLTLLSNNPNKKVGIYYDEFLLYASYKAKRSLPKLQSLHSIKGTKKQTCLAHRWSETSNLWRHPLPMKFNVIRALENWS